jgi:uncharacterized protein (TIGR02118 family)
MIRVSVFYPNGAGHKFDMTYYCEKHIPMVQRLLGSALKGTSVEQGIAGGAPGAPATYMAMGHLQFDSIESFQASFGPHMTQITGDIPNYTNAQPILQISEVKL